MPAITIPETSPVFRGEKGRDSLKGWLAEAQLWFVRTNIMCRRYVAKHDLVHLFCLQAFPHDRPAYYWYEASQTELLTSVPGSTSGTLTANLFAKLKEHFADLDADNDQELQNLTLSSGDDLSTFAHKYVKLHKASTVPEKELCLCSCKK